MKRYNLIRHYNNIHIGDECKCQSGAIGRVCFITFTKDTRKGIRNGSLRVLFKGYTKDGKRWQSMNPVKI